MEKPPRTIEAETRPSDNLQRSRFTSVLIPTDLIVFLVSAPSSNFYRPVQVDAEATHSMMKQIGDCLLAN